MPLLSHPIKPVEIPFDKEKLLEEVNNLLRQEFPFYKILYPVDQGEVWDLVLIRSKPIQQMIRVSSINPFEKEVSTMMQEVIAISLVDPNVDIDAEQFKSTIPWTKLHIAIDNVASLRRRLNNDI